MKMTDLAYQELKSAIVSLRIRPGERLDTESIGVALGFSRAPVMEALNMLRAEGLVVSRRRVGTFASEIGRQQIAEVFDARNMLEQHLAPVIVHNVSDRQVAALAEILAEASALLNPPEPDAFNYPRFMELDALFHGELIRLSEHKIYQKWFDELSAHMQRVRNLFRGNALERSREGQGEHGGILDALSRRNVGDLRQQLLNHTARSRRGAEAILDKALNSAAPDAAGS